MVFLTPNAGDELHPKGASSIDRLGVGSRRPMRVSLGSGRGVPCLAALQRLCGPSACLPGPSGPSARVPAPPPFAATLQ